MRITRAAVLPFALTLRAPLQTAHGAIALREGILLRLDAESGASGWGEASPLTGFGTESLPECHDALRQLARDVVGCRIGDRESVLGDAQAERSRSPATRAGTPATRAGTPAARAALDGAWSDLLARGAGQSMAHWLGGAEPSSPRVHVNALISGSQPDALEASVRDALGRGFRVLKLKVGAEGADDVGRVAQVRRLAGPDVELRLDANGAWSEAQAASMLEALAPHGIEYVEQPVEARDLGAMARLRAASPIAIAADEAVSDEASARAVLAKKAADVIVLKPAAVGGLGSAWRIAEWAAEQGVEVVVTSFLDSAIGVASALHLAAALSGAPGQCRRANGLATGALLETDLARLPIAVEGFVTLPPGAGLGIVPDPEALARLAVGPALEVDS